MQFAVVAGDISVVVVEADNVAQWVAELVFGEEEHCSYCCCNCCLLHYIVTSPAVEVKVLRGKASNLGNYRVDCHPSSLIFNILI